MGRLALATFSLAALGAAAIWTGRSLAQGTFGGGGPGSESEPNDRLGDANPLGEMPAPAPLAVWGEIAHAQDRDVYRIDVLVPTSLDLHVVTGAAKLPASGVGGSGGPGAKYTDSFLPTLAFYGPDGRLAFVFVSSAPNLLLLDLKVPLFNASFYAEVTACPGAFGPYGMQVSVH